MSKFKTIPLIDLFAGPGGLGEGFSSLRKPNGEPIFQIKLSIEKDPVAHRTLLLRSFYRQFPTGRIPAAYYDFLRRIDVTENRRKHELFGKYPEQGRKAAEEARLAELGKDDPDLIHQWIDNALKGNTGWVLIGGPPCQAYSLAGRSRNKGIAEYKPESDKRQYLYLEYLQIIADHRPVVFVMENVKGLLSATLNNQLIFDRILEDLKLPHKALQREGRNIRKSAKTPISRYKIYSLVSPDSSENFQLGDFVVRMENYGIPQARHRVVLLGIRDDFGDIVPKPLEQSRTVTAGDMLFGLPTVRSGLSNELDDASTWINHLQEISDRRWFNASIKSHDRKLYQSLKSEISKISQPKFDRGGEFVAVSPDIKYRRDWFLDSHIDGVCNHSTRAHIVKDLYRYFFASTFAKTHSRSPNLKDFPADLLPNHANVDKALNGSLFADRFRVQLYERPATTITSHIAKDGHYYIHPDPAQCRSLTVREAARIQTFPDNYFFCGPRTSQYVQVGNAVPPLLANQIAGIVSDILKRSGFPA